MSRNLADLKVECLLHGLEVTPSGKRESKGDFEQALREFYWDRDHAGEEMPEQIIPMLARNVKDVDDSLRKEMTADGGNWVAQEKINGCRALLKIRHGQINHITSRRISDETYRLNELHNKMPHYRDMELGPEWDDTILDGEVLMPCHVVDTSVYDGKGVVTTDILQATAATMNCDPAKSVAIQEKFGKLVLHVFDCLRFQGMDIRDLPYAVLTPDGGLDVTKESRYLFAMKAVMAVTFKIGELPWDPGDAAEHMPAVDPAPVCEQDTFAELIG